jgi:hypothetical protein
MEEFLSMYDLSWIKSPEKIWSRKEILDRRECPIPKERGIYGWFFKEIPPIVPIENCVVKDNLVLLYVGISPTRRENKRTLYDRIVKCHFNGNASISTLRLSLGCLLADKLKIRLQKIGGKGRMSFGPGETTLSKWISEKAFVCCQVNSQPWNWEKTIISQISLPLNLTHNQAHPFYKKLKEIRDTARKEAKDK